MSSSLVIRPPKPTIPVPGEDESIPEDLTINSTDIDLSEVPPPPAPPDDDASQFFVAYDEAPEIIGGLSALLSRLEYPNFARKAGVEGKVITKVLVNTKGVSGRVEILQVTPPDMRFEESAIKALMTIKWKPAKQRDKTIKTWITVPVIFRLAQ